MTQDELLKELLDFELTDAETQARDALDRTSNSAQARG